MMTHQGLGRLIFVVVAACGGSKPAARAPEPKPDPIPHTAGPTCKVVGDHMVTLAERDVAHPEADTTLAQTIANRCQTDHWTDDVRSCFATINTDAEGDGCTNMLPKEQRQALADDRAKLGAKPAAAADAAPEEKPARATRGAVKKDAPKPKPKSKSKASDPCEGGE